MNPNDSAQSKSAVIKARLKFPTEKAFVEKYSPNVSKAGIFIKTPQPRAVGTRLKFEFQIADGTPVLRGIGEVTWTRADTQEDKPAGMGVKFIKLDAHSQEVLERILKYRAGGGAGSLSPSRFSDAPPPAAEEEGLPPQPETVEMIEAEEAVAPVPEPEPQPEPQPEPEHAPQPEPAAAAKSETLSQPSAAKSIHRRIVQSPKARSLDLSEIDSALAQIAVPEKPVRTRTLKRRALISHAPLPPAPAEAPPAPEQLPRAKPRAADPDSGITLVTGHEPTFEPSVRVPLRQLESPETPIELDLGAEIEIKEDSGSTGPKPEPKADVEAVSTPAPDSGIDIASSAQPLDDITERVEVSSQREDSGDRADAKPDFEIPYEEEDGAADLDKLLDLDSVDMEAESEEREKQPSEAGEARVDGSTPESEAPAPEDGGRKKGFFKKLFS